MTRADRIPPQPATARYRSVARFYAADPRRGRSRERDVGLWWRDAADGPLHRAAWVCDTGELYLARLGPAEEGGGEVEVLARIEDGERLERALEGWHERCGEPRSLSWLRERARLLSLVPGARRHRDLLVVGVAGTLRDELGEDPSEL